MKNLISVLFCLWVLPGLALPPETVRDINADGVKETVYCHQYMGGNHLWLTVRVVRQGETVFYNNTLSAEYGDCRLINIDSNSPGDEVITLECKAVDLLKPLAKQQNSFMVEIYDWNKEKERYQIRWALETSKQYKPNDFKSVLRDLPKEQTRLTPALSQAADFVQAVKSRDWVKVKTLLDPGDDAPKLAEIKLVAKVIDKLPLSSEWYVGVSPHDKTYFVVTIFVPKATDGMYNIVVNPKGINKFFEGGGD